ncbi:MAG: hypothetical protein SOT28_11795 [Fusicatenibacter sp.]|nr:hypothetical protein [Fusicatenibacter sp.]
MKTKKIITAMINLFLLTILQACAPDGTYETGCPNIPVYQEMAYNTALCQRMKICDTRTIRFTYHAAKEETLYYEEEDLHYSAFFVSPGSVVQKGDLLCCLDLENYPDLLSEAMSALEDLSEEQSFLDRQLQLSLRRQAITGTGSTKRERQAAEEAIKLRYEQQKRELEDELHILEERIAAYQSIIQKRQLYAPFDGTVTYVYSPGASDLSKKNQRIVTVTDDSEMLFTAKTEYHSCFQPETEYLLNIAGEDRIATTVFPESESVSESETDIGTVSLSLKVPDYDLEDGTFGTVQLSLEEKEGVLGIPKKALSLINGRTVVYLLGEDGFRTYREVETGIESSSHVEIISGLNEGDEVLLPD